MILWAIGTALAGEVELSGWVAPEFDVTVRPDAQPVDRTVVGVERSQAGLTFHGRPVEQWLFRTQLVIGGGETGYSVLAVTDIDLADEDNDGDSDTVMTEVVPVLVNIVDEATVAWIPHKDFRMRGGAMRIPFTEQAQRSETALLFPSRPSSTRWFLPGTDFGGLAEFRFWEERIRGSVGVFNGTGRTAGWGDELGVLYNGRLDVTPVGVVPLDEEMQRARIVPEGFRVSFGAGLAYNPYSLYDSAGEEDVRVFDWRMAASARLSWQGLSVSGEYMRRFVEDSLTFRPLETTGAYGEAAWTFGNGLQPMARYSWLVEDESFDPRERVWYGGGIAIYPYFNTAEQHDNVRVLFDYALVRWVSQQELAHNGEVQVRVFW